MLKAHPMNLNINDPARGGIVIALLIILILGILSLIPTDYNETLNNAFIDLQFKMRGQRYLSDKIVIVYIGSEDIDALNGYPITRDYYGYMIHILNSLGARTIGIDVLFERADPYYKEYDQMLAEFIESAGNICLPVAFAATDRPSERSILRGENISLPHKAFANNAAALGFSNFGNDANMRKVPIVISHDDSMYFSFGFELARLFLDYENVAFLANSILLTDSSDYERRISTDEIGRIRLNHFGDASKVTSIGFVDLMRNYELSKPTIDLRDKLVLVSVTAPGIANLRMTPFTQSLPASFIHATVAENIIQDNYLRDLPVSVQWIAIALIVFSIWFFFRFKKFAMIIISSSSLLAGFAILSMILFIHFHLVLPQAYPMIAFLTSVIIFGIQKAMRRRSETDTMRHLLEEQITLKESQLKEARQQLQEMQDQLKQESDTTDELEQLAEERKQSILQLEKELKDLQSYMMPEEEDDEQISEFTEIVHAKTSSMADVLNLVTKVSKDDIPVLIMGETGTGKEMIARAIHRSSSRANSPFIAVNCGALPETLLESELFGHEKGSFTGAQSRRRGRFELADGGTIFLDEISETSQSFQAKLLRVLQEGSFERLGGEQTTKADVRIIAATNVNLNEEMAKGNFRSDLFYRLNGFPIIIPPLRERMEDIPLLAVHFLRKHNYKMVSAFSGQAMDVLRTYHWSGNVRELENVVRRAAILARSENRDIIREGDLPDELSERKSESAYKPFETQVLESLRSLKFSRSAISQTARALGNRDRGTITEYFRGICFEYLVEEDFDIDKAARAIGATTDEKVVERVKSKINEYLENLRKLDLNEEDITEESITRLASPFKGLPKKYHSYLRRIIEYLAQN
ncbi:CHASE2 domain-containing protein [candidate division KSB1 bacterium]|nr:CHASE2 domain-containing protein [candidate division KSB1 bacterium]